MKPLDREQIEMLRASLLDSEWCGFSKRKTVHALCDTALASLAEDRRALEPASGERDALEKENARLLAENKDLRRELNESIRDAVAEANWKHKQGDEYGSY